MCEMKISCVVALVCAGTVFGQGFGQLASNLDGSALYFSSPLRLKGSGQFFHPKIFISDNNGTVSMNSGPRMCHFHFHFFSVSVSSGRNSFR